MQLFYFCQPSFLSANYKSPFSADIKQKTPAKAGAPYMCNILTTSATIIFLNIECFGNIKIGIAG